MKKNKLEKILIIPDCHVPYENKEAVALMLQAATGFKPDHVVLLGDVADFYSVSSHSKDPNRALKMEDEINATKNFLDKIAKLKAKNNVFIAGNHENRLERYLQDSAPELFNLVSIPKILELKEKGFKYVPYKQSYKLGKMNFTHDVGTAGRYAHYKSLDAFQRNVIIGHTHRLGYIVEGNADGERHLGAMFGWLGDVNAVDYMHRIKAVRDWTLGFGIGYLDRKTGAVYTVPVPIINGTCLVEGMLYKGKK